MSESEWHFFAPWIWQTVGDIYRMGSLHVFLLTCLRGSSG